jgi:tRNA(Ile)-lysidine synthase
MNRIQPDFLRRFPPNERYLVGLSGGRDSVALLHWLIESGYAKLIVCHLNHRLRGRASETDARFVEKLVANCKKKIVGQAHLSRRSGTKVDRLPKFKDGKRSARPTTSTPHITLKIGTTDVRALATKQKMSIEAAGREARYKFFALVAKRRRLQTIFLAHHADDVVETFLINLFRGSGPTGLAAIREVSKRRVDGVDLTIVRPFVGLWRCQIDDYVRKHRLKFREDASNSDLALFRNRVRRKIIPYLEKAIGRNIRQSIWRAAVIAAEEENWIGTQLPNTTGTELSVLELRKLPVALQRRGILKWLRDRKITNVGFDVVENVRALLDPESRTAKANLPQGRYARRRAKKIFITN